jgi:thioredoxin-related protein
MNTDCVLDSSFVIGGEFLLKGDLNSQVEHLWLYVENPCPFKFLTNLYMGNEKIFVSGDVNEEKITLKIKGSLIHDGYSKLEECNKSLRTQRDSIVSVIINSQKDQNEKNQMWNVIKNIDQQIVQRENLFIVENPNSYYSVIKLFQNKTKFSKDSLLKVLNSLSEEITDSKYGKAIRFFCHHPVVKEGGQYYDFSASDLDGNNHKISKIEDKYKLLVFCKPRCGACGYALEQLGSINQKYQDSLEVVSFFVTGNIESWRSESEKYKCDWLTIGDLKGEFSETVLRYNVKAFPTFFLIDRNGVVKNRDAGCGPGFMNWYMRNAFK